MKFIKKIILAVATLATCYTASAQYNVFEENRVINIPVLLTSTSTVSNVFDISGFQGVALVHVAGFTNIGGATLTCQLVSSPDLTNWTAVPYAIGTANTTIITNSFYAAALTGTNTYILPGAVTTPTASTAGFNTSYIATPVYTNVAATSITGAGKIFAFNTASTSGRYLSVIFNPSGASVVTGCIVGKKQQNSVP